LFSGLYESNCYKQLSAKSEKQAIIQIVSFFMDSDPEQANAYLTGTLGNRWIVNNFWKKHHLKFANSDDTVTYTLIWIKQVAFDLDTC
jgi:hypothetical protein